MKAFLQAHLETQTTCMKIAGLLADLEVATGRLVESVCIEERDITTIDDHAQRVVRSVRINLRPELGGEWHRGSN